MIKVYYYKIEKVSPLFTEREKKLFRLISPRKIQRISSAVSEEVRRTSFYGEIITLGLLVSEYSVTSLPRIEYTEKGKPFLSGGSYFFNISHTGGCIFIAFSDSEIGIDAEIRRVYDRKIASKCFSSAELSLLDNASDKDGAFTRIWTRKEAYVKYTGQGIDLSLFRDIDSFDRRIRTVSVKDRYTLSVFSEKESDEIILREITPEMNTQILNSLEPLVYD